MSKAISELRMWLAEELLGLAVKLAPEGEDGDFLTLTLDRYFRCVKAKYWKQRLG